MKLLKKRIKRYVKPFLHNFIIKYYPDLLDIKKSEYYNYIISITKKTTRIINTDDTYKAILGQINTSKPGAYMRFGDGDAYLVVGIDDILQRSSTDIKREMHEAFSLSDNSIFKSLSLHSNCYGYDDKMYLGNHLMTDETANNLLGYTFPYFIGNKIYSPVFLHYFACYKPHEANYFLRKVKEKCILFIGNESVSELIVLKLFGDVKHIKTPPANAYDKIDEIEYLSSFELEKTNGYGIVVVAMGCSGRILIKRLISKKYNVFYFDFGSLLDGICENKSREWLKYESIDYNVLLENL